MFMTRYFAGDEPLLFSRRARTQATISWAVHTTPYGMARAPMHAYAFTYAFTRRRLCGLVSGGRSRR